MCVVGVGRVAQDSGKPDSVPGRCHEVLKKIHTHTKRGGSRQERRGSKERCFADNE